MRAPAEASTTESDSIWIAGKLAGQPEMRQASISTIEAAELAVEVVVAAVIIKLNTLQFRNGRTLAGLNCLQIKGGLQSVMESLIHAECLNKGAKIIFLKVV